MASIYKSVFPSPLGLLQLFSMNNQLVQLLFENESAAKFLGREEAWILQDNECLINVKRQLQEFFLNQRTDFDLPLYFHGTDFQTTVWKQLQNIPFGTTKTYSEIANQISKPSAVRAVGGAIGKNPIPLIVPCHRVIGANGKLTGFLGGLDLKKKILQFENKDF